MKLSGWGQYPVLECRVEHLRRPEQLPGFLDSGTSLIARGNGRSYGDASLNPALTLSMLEMDRLQAFDARTGLLTCEAGVMLSDILETFVPRGWFPPVVPGTKFVTVGGMIAADIHGKNHHLEGSFGTHVESLTLAMADGALRVCSRSENTDLFYATIGGMGLTGVIISASVRLKPIETSFVKAETLSANDLDETMALFEDSHNWPFSVAWIDCLARGQKFGRTLVSRARKIACNSLPENLAHDPLRPALTRTLSVPIDMPSVAINRISVGLFNELYYRHSNMRAGMSLVHFDPYFFPLDRIMVWNRLYGRRGFVQYQCVLPKSESPDGIAALLECVRKARQCSPLAVLKLFGPGGEGLMSFPMEGYTLSLDFPMRDGTLDLLNALDRITHDHGGRIYLAKDACSTPERLRQGYPDFDAFNAVRAEATGMPDKFASQLSQRLKL